MNIPVRYECKKCKSDGWVTIEQEDSHFNYDCPCGYEGSVYLGNTYTIGEKLLEKSFYEYKENKDYSLSIVLSAMAFESEISTIYIRVKEINNSNKGIDTTDEDLEQWENELRKMSNIENKINQIFNFLANEELVPFVKKDAEFSEVINECFPSLDVDNLSFSFTVNLFWLRNKILHLGYNDVHEIDARRCLNIASIGINIFNKMDNSKM